MDVHLPLLGVILLQCNSAFVMSTVSDTVVLAGESTTLNCSGSCVNWIRHYLEKDKDTYDVYINKKIADDYIALGFRIDQNQQLHSNNLVIENVTTDLAGKYECRQCITKNESNSTEVMVLEKLPECHVNMDEFIGPNDCNVPMDDIQLSCSAKYRGNKPPQLEWRRHGEAIEVFESKCTTEDNSLTMCSTTVKPDVVMNGSYFVCQTTKRAAKEQYNCTTSITVLYSFGSEESKRTAAYTGDRVECTANSSQSCSYKWVWYEKVGNDLSRTIESTDNILFAKRIGLHRCEAQCDLRNHKCIVFPKFVDVIQSEKSAEYTGLHQTFEQENNQWIPSLTSSLLLGIFVLFAFGCYLFTRNRNKKPPDGSQNTSSESITPPQD